MTIQMGSPDNETQPSDAGDFALIGYVDLDGIIRGKYATASKIASLREAGGVFCSVVLDCVSRGEL